MPGILHLIPLTPVEIPRLYGNRKSQSVTLAYGGEKDDYSKVIGLPVELSISGEAWSKEIQALTVILPSWVPCQNRHPHLTLSWVDGSAPVKANLMLAGEHKLTPLNLTIHCTIEWIEWESAQSTRSWKSRSKVQCAHVGKGGDQCPTFLRSATGYCRHHRPKQKPR